MKIELPNELFNEEELEKTPHRYKMFLEEWIKNRKFKFTTFPNPGYDQMIISKNIDFSSLCSHHLLPFLGKINIAYIPDMKICGISKLARVVDKFASRPQMQEKMTQEIVNFLDLELKPRGVMVVVEATHYCMVMRGVKKSNSKMITSAVSGLFLDEPHTKEEFFNLLK